MGKEQARRQGGCATEIRTFIAIEIAPAIIDRLTTVQQQLRRTAAQVAWTRPEGVHLTLKFLGNVPEERLPALGEALGHVAQHYTPFPLRVEGIGGFPNLRHPRVLWAGIGEGQAPVSALAREVDETLTALGFPREERPFSPHLTLGRVKSPDGLAPLLALLATQADSQFGEMRVEAVSLMRSDLLPQGAKYTELYRVALDECEA